MHIKSIKNFVLLILTSLLVLLSLEAVVSLEAKTDKTLLNHQSVNRNVTSTSSSLVPSPSSSRSSVDADEEEEEGEGEDAFEEEVTDEEGTGLESTSGPSTSSSPGNEEEKPPDLPTALHAKATASNIHVTWMPPKDRKTAVRGYTIGWGVGVPDVYSKVLDPKTRSFTISDLKPQVEYVISLRAYNNMGDGQPAYASLRTLAADTEEGVTTIFPPVGLKANILSSSTVVLQWTDSGRQTTATDNRQYVIRYTSNFRSVSPKYKFGYSNRTTLMIDGLKPATQYEFSVKVVKGKTESTWSMSVINSTLDASPSSPPRDLTIVADEDNASAVRLHWQPPKYPNGQITGYIILYTTDETRPEREWSVHPLVGDKMNTMITDMLPDTLYFFKIQAKNEKGSGPVSSPAISFRTLALSSASTTNLLRKGPSVTSSVTSSSSSTEPIYITMIAVVSVVTLVLIFIVTLILCRGYNRKSSSTAKYSAAATSPRSSARNNKNRASRELNPPDLWIHHDQLELKSLDKNQDPDMTPTPVLRTFQDPLLTSCNSVSPAPPPSLNSSLGLVGGVHGGPCGHSSIYDDVNRGISVPSPASSVDHHHSNQLSIFPPASNTNTSTIRRTGRAKPIMIPAESVGILSTSGNNTASTAFDSSTILRPVYPVNGRNSYNIHGTLSKGNGGSHQLNCYEVNDCNLYDPVTGLSSSGVGMTMSLLHTTSFPTPAPTLSSSNVSYSSPTHSGNSASGGGGSINSPTMSDQPPPPPSLNHTHLHHHHLQQHQYQNHQHHCLTTSSPSMNNLAPSGTRMPLTLQTPLRSYDIHSSSCTPSSSSTTSSSSTCANNSQPANNVTPKQIGK